MRFTNIRKALAASGLILAVSAATPVVASADPLTGSAEITTRGEAQGGLGMDAIVIYGCNRLGGVVVRGSDGHLYCER